jgi:ATP-dependent Clp protease ATP-binding subunit ClpA
MDHATLTDNNGRKSDFRNVVLIMTTNAGSREMAAGKIGFGDSLADNKDGKKAIERVFTPEFRNRLDGVVLFDALPPPVIRKVVQKFLDQLDGQLNEKRVTLEVTDAAKEWFAEKGYDKAMGARPMARLIQSTLKAPLANEILFGKLTGGGVAHVDVERGEIVVRAEPAPGGDTEDDDDRPPPPRRKAEKPPVN